MISRIRISASFRLVNEGYFVPAAAEIAKAVSCPVIVVGGFRSIAVMEEVLNGTDIELISLSRPLLCEPDLPDKMMEDPAVISKCVSCQSDLYDVRRDRKRKAHHQRSGGTRRR